MTIVATVNILILYHTCSINATLLHKNSNKLKIEQRRAYYLRRLKHFFPFQLVA